MERNLDHSGHMLTYADICLIIVGHILTEDNEGEVAYRQLLTITDYDEANSHNNDDDDDDDSGCRNAATEFAAVGRATTHAELTHFVSKLLTLMTSIIIGSLIIVKHCMMIKSK